MTIKYKSENKLDNSMNNDDIEARCRNFWEQNYIYKYIPNNNRDNTFSVDTPPPTVSGTLHIGHIFSYTQTDVIVRFNRMLGKSIFYPIGWDDNGLPTERRVQNYYNINCNPAVSYDPDFKPVHNEKADKSPKKEVSRQNFIETCWKLTAEDEKIFENVFRQIGHSYDWDLKYETINSHSIKTSQYSFLDLIEKGMAYSSEAPTMWDTTFKSAIAQAEIEDKEMIGHFYDIKFKTEDGGYFIISTTRPELLAACIAVVAHPDDERYKHLFSKTAIVPIFDIPVKIYPSTHADPEKGTGIMMVCTFGDIADVEWWKQQNNLPIKQIIDLNGKIRHINYGEAPFETINQAKARENYNQIIGLKIKQAKEKVAQLLLSEGVLVNEPREINHIVKFYEKGDLPLEFVSSRQWFIDILSYKNELLEQGRKIKWHPAHMQTRYENWVEGLNQNWCISRQRFFGVPFPVWYKIDENGNVNYDEQIFATKSMLPVDPMLTPPPNYSEEQRGKPNGFIGDNDVMDTWATSSLTPQIASGWVENDKNHSSIYPFDIRPQSHDIIRTWAFYTIMKSFAHEKQIPWENTVISGFILDPDRKKMSKSKGNVVTPAEVVTKYSADAVRYWASRAKLGIDTAYEEQIMTIGKKITMKLFNASRFVFNIIENANPDVKNLVIKNISNPLDISWLNKLSGAVNKATESFNKFDYASALEATEHTFWDFCDNYLEIIKTRAYSGDISALASLATSINTFAKLFAPFMPYITEEIYQCSPNRQDEAISVHNSKWPTFALSGDADLYENTVKIVELIRKAKADEQKSLRWPVVKMEVTGDINNTKIAEIDIANAVNFIGEKIIFTLSKSDLELTEFELSLEKE